MRDRIKMTEAAAVVIGACALTAIVSAAGADLDSVFVGKVSQGGRYEVEASKIAEKRAVAQDVKNLAVTELHDHELVNKALARLAAAAGISIAPDLNDEFQKRLVKLGAVVGYGFDAAYVEDMKQIHDKDEKLFAQEAIEGSAGFKAFAHQTDLIVKRHIGALRGTD